LPKPFLLKLSGFETKIAEKWVSSAYKRLFYATWSIGDNPEFFDHHIDLYYQWLKTRRSWWLERGVFGSLAIKRGGSVLELASGDGFNARNFYSAIAGNVIACDFDKDAIRIAETKNKAENIVFLLRDIRYNMPEGSFDNIVWDAAIEHFTEIEINTLMQDIKGRLSQKNGILSGYTIVERSDGKSLKQHEYEFKSMQDLKRFLSPHFKNVLVFETIYPERHNLYFWASDGILPFSGEWNHWLP
jgi:ubiquinone/menaquinone biosynthesis C-methylase UbiE